MSSTPPKETPFEDDVEYTDTPTGTAKEPSAPPRDVQHSALSTPGGPPRLPSSSQLDEMEAGLDANEHQTRGKPHLLSSQHVHSDVTYGDDEAQPTTCMGKIGFWARHHRIMVLFISVTVAIAFIGFVYGISTVTPADKGTDPDGPWTKARLPSSIQPYAYDLFIHPNITQKSFQGRVKISFKTTTETDTIILHGSQLAFSFPEVVSLEDGQSIPVHYGFPWDANQFYVVQVAYPLPSDTRYSLTMKFGANFSSNLGGMYLSQYTTGGVSRNLVATKFQPVSARRVFPLLDEPTFKATFTVSIVRDLGMSTLFNTPLAYTEFKNLSYPNPDLSTGSSVSKSSSSTPTPTPTPAVVTYPVAVDHFVTTPVMNGHNLAWIISEFVSVTVNATAESIPVSIWAPAENLDSARWALNVTVKSLDFFRSLFARPYPLSKLDLVALPDLAADAFESWGLVTFQQAEVFWVDGFSAASKQKVALNVAQVIALQWFGNLVTMQWWNEEWVASGFATFASYWAIDSAYPEFEVGKQFVVSALEPAVQMDSYWNARALDADVNSAGEIEGAFNGHSYKKGAALMVMLKSLVGETAFVSGVKSFISKFAYKSVQDDDFFGEISAFSSLRLGVDIHEIMNTWSKSPGVPMISVAVTDESTVIIRPNKTITPPDAGSLIATQEPFTHLPTNPLNINSLKVVEWDIPIIYSTNLTSAANPPKRLWLDSTWGRIGLTGSEGLVTVNSGQVGYYRVKYSNVHWAYLAAQLQNAAALGPAALNAFLSPVERAGVLDDAFDLARAGEIPYAQALEMTRFLVNEREYVVWFSALNGFEYIRAHSFDQGFYSLLCDYVVSLLTPTLNELGPFGMPTNQTITHSTTLLRALIYDAAFTYNEPNVQLAAVNLFQQFVVKKPNDPKWSTLCPAEMRPLVFRAGAEFGHLYEFDALWKYYLKYTVSAEEKQWALEALAHSQIEMLLSKLLQYTLDVSKIRRQDASIVVTAVARNSVGVDPILRFLQRMWDFLQTVDDGTAAVEVLTALMRHIDTNEFVGELTDFFAEHSLGPAATSYNQLFEEMQGNLMWRRQSLSPVCSWLAALPIAPSDASDSCATIYV